MGNNKYSLLILLSFALLAIIFFLREPKTTDPTVITSIEVLKPKNSATTAPAADSSPPARPSYKSPEIKNTATLKESLYLDELKESNPAAHAYVVSEKALRQKGYGSLEHVKDLNHPQVRSVVEALQTGLHPERLSPAIAPKPFDQQKFLTDKAYAESYLNTVEPGRVLQGQDNAPSIKRLSPYLQNVEQGKSVYLRVECTPGFPCTFTSYDNGVFDNGLSSQTVIADSSGLAQVQFHGVSGVGADSKILSSSPVNSGNVKFIVYTKRSL